MAKKKELGEDTCGARCPKCGTDPACAKSWSHAGNSDHWCMNCGNTWPSK